MHLSLVSWNINSVRLRIDQVARFAAEHPVDVLCLQEIKCEASQFPEEAFHAMGFPHLLVMGQKGWHGVALASKVPFETVGVPPFCRRGEARAQAIRIGELEIWNFYIPAGGDLPDRASNPKFDHKLDFFETLTAAMARRDPQAPLVVAGDLNVAPGEFDVWNHRYMSKVVSHTPIEVEAFAQLMTSLDFIDIVREAIPDPAKIASWWSYRAADFRASNRGLRLDHLLLSPGLRDAAFRTGAPSARIHEDVRAWDKPSDHAPVSVDLML